VVSLRDLQEAADRTEAAAREQQARLTALAPYGVELRPPRVVASFDEAGLLDALTFTGDGPVALIDVWRDIETALVGVIPRRAAASAAVFEDAVDAVLSEGPATTVANGLRTVVVTARNGVILGVRVDGRHLGGGSGRLICDEVLPVARRAQLASDALGLFGGTR
jgi:hypothetical protein